MMTVGSSTAATARKSLFIEQVADPNMLREAWYRGQRGGRAAGVDGMTVDAFRPYAERRLTELGQALLAETYRPAPVKRVQIPKPTGGWRIVGMPTITDRIAQTAAALIVHDRVAALFSDRSFA
jgi:retron-type reverse transcriptase